MRDIHAGMGQTMDTPVPVVYIAGWGRSGSTLVGNILGSMQGWVHVGELQFIWRRGLHQNRLCGCGTPFRSCPWWRPIVAALPETRDPDVLRTTLRTHRSMIRTRRLVPYLFGPGRDRILRRYSEHRQRLERLYRQIHQHAGHAVLVDSSKLPAYLYILTTLPGLDVKVLHLVRDPRAVAHSWQREKYDPSRGGPFVRAGALPSSYMWMLTNMAVERIGKGRLAKGRYYRLRYEDLVRNPRTALQSAADALSLTLDDAVFEDDRTVRIGTCHTIAGNPDRFRMGRITIRPREQWRTGLTPRDRVLVAMLTLPGRIKYGYFVRADRGP